MLVELDVLHRVRFYSIEVIVSALLILFRQATWQYAREVAG